MKNEKQGQTVLHLSGDESWRLAIDPRNVGREEAWWNGARDDAKTVRVPWIMQDAFPDYHGVAWYWRAFTAPELTHARERALLHFEAVDYLCEVWLNGVPVGGHEGGEGPFTLDATNAIRAGSDNLLAVRVLNPRHEPIDGIALGETPHRCKCDPYIAGGAFNHGGITAPVQLVLAPPIRLEDLWVRADADSGKVRVQARAQNDEAHTVSATIEFSLASPGESVTLTNHGGEYSLAPGENVVEAELAVDDPQLWQLNEPNLYRVSCRLNAEDGDSDWLDERAVRCGFRDFRFKNGYFRLNGKRLFLKGTHTLNHTPVGLQVPHDPDLLRRDLLNLKVMGFNMVRFIWGGAVPYQLDLCDEIGLLVYNETYASHAFSETPRMGTLFDQALTEVVQRDRNHASVVIWGLLNEINDSPLFRHAAASLPLLRELDDTRMVMLDSGRFDKDLTLGSFSNPGSHRWDAMLGDEGAAPADSASTHVTPPPTPAAHEDLMEQGDISDKSALLSIAPTMDDAPETIAESAGGIGAGWSWEATPGYVADAGDVHLYPRVPQLPLANEILRHLGKDSPQPILLSEYGIGSAVDLWRVTRHYERLGATHAEDAVFYRDKLDRYLRDWQQWKLDEVFVAPPEFFAQSLAKMASQRTLGINAIRANPNLAGYSLTGAIDHVMCGEGLTTLFRELKPGTTDAIYEGFAPLRLCLFAEPPHLYRGGSLRLEAVLANEDALGAGDYRVQLQVVGPQMERVFQRTVSVTVPERNGAQEAPLAIPFFDEQIAIDGSSGRYRFVAFLEEGGAATGGETAFFVTDAAEMPPVEEEVVLWGEDAELLNWLSEHGIRARSFQGDENDEPRVLAVSRAAHGAASMEEWRDLARRIARGATVVFLSPEVFARDESPLFWLPLENKGAPTSIRGWLYLKDEWAKNHPIFDGLPAGGLLDYNFYRELISDALFAGQDAPDEAVAGAIKASQDYDSGLMLAVYQLGAGRIILNTMHVLENLGSHPAAERLLRNLLRYAASTRDAAAPVELPPNFEETLARLYPPYPVSAFKLRWQASSVLPERPITKVALPDASLSWSPLLADEKRFVSFFARDGHSSGLVYARGEIEVPQNMQVEVLLGPDGPCKAWLDEELIGTIEYAQNPGSPDKQAFPIALTAGRHVVTVAFHRRGGQAWGFFLRFKRVGNDFSAEELQTGQALLPTVDP